MAGKTKIKEFIAYSKISSSKLAYSYTVSVNSGKDASCELTKLMLLRSYIKSLESCAGIKRKSFLTGACDCECFCVKTCLNSKEICNLVDRIKSIIKIC